MGDLNFTASFKNNALIIFDSLPPSELNTAARLESDITDYSLAMDRDGYCQRFHIENKASLVAHLKSIRYECQSGVLKPALHFENHGNKERGLHIYDSNEYLTWIELLDLIREINSMNGNNTLVTVAACHGYSMASEIDVSKPCPLNTLIAPKEEVSAGYFIDAMIPFYKSIMASGNLLGALKHLDSKMDHFIACEFFYSQLASFFGKYKSTKSRSALTEELVTQTLSLTTFKNRHDLRTTRALLKRTLREPRDFFEHFSRAFLGDNAPVRFDQFWAFVQSNKD